MVEAVIDAVDDGSVGEQRGKAPPTGLYHIIGAADVQIAFVLTGEACRRQILGSGGTADGDRDVRPIVAFELAIGLDDCST
jgi:hypothetical protein